MRGLRCLVPALALAGLCASPQALGWHGRGHDLAARAAVLAAADQMPPFFTEGLGQIAHNCLDPDAWTRPLAPEALHAAESSEHYFDQELLGGLTPPPRRNELLRLCAAQGIDATRLGFLPYAVTEWTGRLTVALAEHRRWPDNPFIRLKVLVYAGILAHYAADLYQPLHLTIHWDGRVDRDGKSPRTGIHLKVDALAAKLDVSPCKLAHDLRPQPVDDVWAAVLERMAQTHRLVDDVYQLEPRIPAKDEPLAPDSPAAQWVRRQLAEAAGFTASLYVTAWRDSQAIFESLPDWHVAERQELDGKSLRSPAVVPAGPASRPSLRPSPATPTSPPAPASTH